MKSIIYVSTAARPLETPELSSLVAEAAGRNMESRVTGLLAFNGVNFMQLLEGPEAAVEETMARIARDPRHFGVVIIRRRIISQRECADWAMTGRVLPLAGLADDSGNALLPGFEGDTRQMFSSFSSLAA